MYCETTDGVRRNDEGAAADASAGAGADVWAFVETGAPARTTTQKRITDDLSFVIMSRVG
jgi:microcompartment protein CcmK/EutM